MDIPVTADHSSAAPINTIVVRKFSKTLAVTYVCLGFFALLSLATSLYPLHQALVSRSPMLLIPATFVLILAAGFICVMLALHQRRNWARLAAVSFWMICLAWSTYSIVRNGLHPQPAAGPFQYSNAQQLAGARFFALVTPYFMALIESTAIYCLVRKADIVDQFINPSQQN